MRPEITSLEAGEDKAHGGTNTVEWSTGALTSCIFRYMTPEGCLSLQVQNEARVGMTVATRPVGKYRRTHAGQLKNGDCEGEWLSESSSWPHYKSRPYHFQIHMQDGHSAKGECRWFLKQVRTTGREQCRLVKEKLGQREGKGRQYERGWPA